MKTEEQVRQETRDKMNTVSIAYNEYWRESFRQAKALPIKTKLILGVIFVFASFIAYVNTVGL